MIIQPIFHNILVYTLIDGSVQIYKLCGKCDGDYFQPITLETYK